MFRVVPFAERNWCRILLADSYTAICFAEGKNGCFVYSLDMLTLAIRELPDMRTSNTSQLEPCYLSERIYVFLSNSPDSQKYSVREQLWSPLTHTRITTFITILVPHISSIYIFLYSNTYRIFNTLMDQIGRSIALRRCFRPHGNSPWVKSAEGKLVCLGKKKLLTWDWNKNAASQALDVQKRRQSPKTQGITLLLGREMYWVWKFSLRIYRVNLDTLKMHSNMLLQE